MSQLSSVRLREVREMRNITQGQLAKRVSSTRSTISGYEGKEGKEPNYELLCKICSALRCSPAYIVGATDDIEGTVYIFPSDMQSFQDAYNKMSRSLRPCVDPAFDALYRLLLPDILQPDRERLELLSDLMRKIASMRSEIRSRIEAADGAMDMAGMAELMSLQDWFKSSVSSMIAELTQADIQAALRSKGKSPDTGSSVAKAM